MSKYNPSKIERQWQKYWEAKKLYIAKEKIEGNPPLRKATEGRGNFMLLAEFPYTSGNLHMGHWFTYSIADVYARYMRMNGYNIMYPIGFDAFGLPAENAAIKNNSTPDVWTKQNIRNMTKQLKTIGAVFDWSRVVDTSSPDYYRWTQWIFLKLYEKSLVYRGETIVNWCPKDKTVLANEQVVTLSTSLGQVGCCERCDTPVEQRKLVQWMFKITNFADALTDDLKNLDWPEDTKVAQVNWIGRSEGAVIKFEIKFDAQTDADFTRTVADGISGQCQSALGQRSSEILTSIKVFTTRPDTLFGATYLVLAPEHSQISNLKSQISNWGEVEKYIEQAKRKTELQRMRGSGDPSLHEATEGQGKTGVELKGVKAINPATKEEIPVWVADYILGGYGTGAIMAVPAHDERDFEFAKKFGLKIVFVYEPPVGLPGEDAYSKAYTNFGYLRNSGRFDDMDPETAKREITKFVGGERKTQYRLRDWILSRQRYWGAPIPMINCSRCGYQPVPETELPVKLPKLADFLPVEGGKSPLARAEKWVKVKCPKCNGPAERETDTMDTFVDSSWYFLRYTDPKNKKEFAAKDKIKKWLPIPLYIGGREHNTMHLLYARFITKALNKLGVINFSEPFLSRRNHGVIMGPDGKRMSKSRDNVVDPDAEVKKYGSDVVRMNFAFLGPFEQDYAWNPKNISGIYRFLNRVWNFINKLEEPKETNKEAERIIHKYIKEIGDDIKSMKFNTGVSGLMKLLNELEDKWLTTKQYETFLKLLAPFAPHIAEELWSRLTSRQGGISQSRILDLLSKSGQVPKNYKSIHLQPWPDYDETLLAEETVTVAIQINGKLRDTVQVKKGLAEDDIKKLVLSREKIKNYLEGKEVRKFIYIQNRLTNIVI
ncbi:MAG: leucine--tRNA ligase [Candidatus Yanofskybacteria bacterium RIFCSPHIGHO2_02_FULL_43_22]|uniref:Leucine--tRNA ligase n=1 Tax=Candidatus Yanofskybacteria bacterium RIFCSPHIGHO2_02_FULL_43_22 TaxID=1802681 RepID=A0A1F8FNL9_9BACT|nr:MAG: leucine--tRNA ligase [Candidatus Yanofskybacteria bacterium RIFCSPHIGHO2_02_FULL_43_22]